MILQMAAYCSTSQYYDSLLMSCMPCHLRCPKLPSRCRDPCQVATQSTEVPLTSVLITHETKGAVSPVIANDSTYVYWILLAFFVLIIPTILVIAIMLKRKQKLHKDSFREASDKIKNNSEHDLKGEDLESALCNEIKIPVAENEEGPMYNNICDKALSDYLFPLPAVEEGAAILVTTKTSAFLNLGPDVRGNAFVEI
ncbi:tumor necrosis factor receptor superfamily member 17 isoform X1 [Mixophyes fleayi]|uniref:tumor necrosis factor receptor superfamily member 17 isoform X1 n=1 Tax=Mixophyes fleayi TaxID=3061075 RepID=UPI003F4E055B